MPSFHAVSVLGLHLLGFVTSVRDDDLAGLGTTNNQHRSSLSFTREFQSVRRDLVHQHKSRVTSKPGYAIWIVPSEEAAEAKLKGAITAMSARFSRNDFTPPVFDPHMTLFGMIYGDSQSVIENKFEELAGEIEPFSIEFSSVEAGTSYFQTVYLKADPTAPANQAVVQANSKLNAGFGATAGVTVEVFNPQYKPHMSLMYNTAENRAEMADEAKAMTEVKEVVDGRVHKKFSMAVDSMELWHLDLDDTTTESWRLAKKAKFGAAQVAGIKSGVSTMTTASTNVQVTLRVF